MSTPFARRTPTCSSPSGAALCGKKTATPELLADVLERLRGLGDIQGSEVVRLPPLFANEAEFDEFEARHATEKVKRADLSSYEGVAYLGIDAGSTTFKSALIGEDGSLLWTFYANNKGDVFGHRQARNRRNVRRAAHRSRRPAESHHWACNRDRLRRGPAARGAARRLRRNRNRRAPSRRTGNAAGRRVHSRHRRPRHEVPARERRRYRPHHAQRGMLFGLRQLHRELRCGPEPRRDRVRENRERRRKSCRSGQPLHRIHELPCEAGSKGRRHRGRYRRGLGHFRYQERPVQGH